LSVGAEAAPAWAMPAAKPPYYLAAGAGGEGKKKLSNDMTYRRLSLLNCAETRPIPREELTALWPTVHSRRLNFAQVGVKLIEANP